jgi:hypothetical protein
MIIEILLLIVVVWQGERVCWYERAVYRMSQERFQERARWRQAKQAATVKKIEQKTADSEKSLELISLNTNVVVPNKTIAAKYVSENL